MDTATARTLSSRLADLLSREQAAMAEFLLALADFDRRRSWESLGYTSLWNYLHRELGLSKSAAFYRSEAAALLQRFPGMEAPLRDGRLCLSSVAELAKVVTAANVAEVLPRFFRRSAREAREVVAELAPRAEVPVRPVVTTLAPVAVVLTSEPISPLTAAAAGTHGPPPSPPPPTVTSIASPRPIVEPLTAELRRLHVTVSRRFLEKLEAARDALSHSKKGADAEAILEAGLDLILAQQAKRRAQVEKPRRAKPVAGDSEHVTAEVRRAVWTRDEGRCQWRLDSGLICGSTRRPQLDHVHPKARGGASTVENLRVLCDAHNQYAARLAFGERWMGRYKRAEKNPAGGRSHGAVT